MCLLVKQTAGVRFDYTLLEDIYDRNPDGIGVVYVENGVVEAHKLVPRDLAEFIEFYRLHIAGRDCAWHARMRTHGDTNLTNCHPYPVELDNGECGWLMHNGILSAGNMADRSKSDTWHYIENKIKPIMNAAPILFHSSALVDLIEDDIGTSNKFVIVTPDGQMTTYNADSGVTWKRSDGVAWMSNTYAWSAERYIVMPRWNSYSAWGAENTAWPKARAVENYGEIDAEVWLDEFEDACTCMGVEHDLDDDTLLLAYDTDPDVAYCVIQEIYDCTMTSALITQWAEHAAMAQLALSSAERAIGGLT